MKSDLESTVLELVLGGLDTAHKIAARMTNSTENSLYSEVKEAVTAILDNPAFQREVNDARADYTGSVVMRFKRNVHRFAGILEECADQTGDIRTRLAAAKEGLHIAGVSGVTKHEIHSPTEYERLVSKYIKKEEKNGHQTGEVTGPSSRADSEPGDAGNG